MSEQPVMLPSAAFCLARFHFWCIRQGSFPPLLQLRSICWPCLISMTGCERQKSVHCSKVFFSRSQPRQRTTSRCYLEASCLVCQYSSWRSWIANETQETRAFRELFRAACFSLDSQSQAFCSSCCHIGWD